MTNMNISGVSGANELGGGYAPSWMNNAYNTAQSMVGGQYTPSWMTNATNTARDLTAEPSYTPSWMNDATNTARGFTDPSFYVEPGATVGGGGMGAGVNVNTFNATNYGYDYSPQISGGIGGGQTDQQWWEENFPYDEY